MQVSCVKDQPNMREGADGDTPEVVARVLSIIRIYAQGTPNTRCHVRRLAKP